ncbi:MAG: hypothetical protein WDA18_04820 [Candidatus Ratteibacteria bacterium]|jgi:NADH:ubiquinone oxidoreductase subunit 3 (subunit A)
MNVWNILLAPPAAFIIFFAIFYSIYRIAGTLAPVGKDSAGKTTSYACGEDIPGFKMKFGYKQYFFMALFFTMMHVAALVVATVPKGPITYFGLLYLGMIFFSVIALITRS